MKFRRLSPEEKAEKEVIKSWDRDVVRSSKRMAYRVGVPDHDDDFAQEARLRLLIAHRSRGHVPKNYGRRIVRNAVVSAARPAIRRQIHVRNDVDVDEVEIDEEGWDVEEVTTIVRRLPRRMRRVYNLLYEQDLSQREAAVHLRVTQPRVAQLHRELIELARALILAA